MNHREPTLVPHGMRRAFHCLLLLAAVLAPESMSATGRHRAIGQTAEGSIPVHIGYLQAGGVGAPPLRFEEPPAPLDPLNRPPLTHVPQVVDPISETEPVVSTPVAPETSVAIVEPTTTESTSGPTTEAPTVEPSTRRTPPPILQDDMRPQVRPEDFLPFFQLPGTSTQPSDAIIFGTVPHGVPTPTTLPPSSATYNQR